jgi:predicted 3-demethylubiquinone-9 3-methyltransferase (glyoxalase superfamily)
MKLQRIQPCLWFNGNAEEAVAFYTGIFPDSRIISRPTTSKEVAAASGIPQGSVLCIEFELDGERFLALNGGPQFPFTNAISLMITCEDQQEIDHYWNQLGAGGPPEAQQCGWLKDKFGLSWQVIPANLSEMMRDAAGYDRMMVALMGMKKLVIADLQRAFNG